MGSIKGNIGAVSTSQHWSSLRTDDDIQKSVTEFLEEESPKLNGKALHESIVEVSRWLGSKIQQEREGWAYKVRVAMQEIETHRRDALRTQGVIQECAEQLRLIAECCNMEQEKLQEIANEEAKHALPMYIECLTEIINSLVEDRLQCLQLLKKEENDSASIFDSLKEYLQKFKFTSEEKIENLQEKTTETEDFNKTLLVENMKLKKQLSKTTEDVEKLKKILHLVNDKADLDRTSASTELPSIGDRGVTPASLRSEPTLPTTRDNTSSIQISEDKLHKIRRSAKKLESSLQDALNQMDNYRKTKQPNVKYGHSSGLPNIKLKPLFTDSENYRGHTNDKSMTISQDAWQPKFEVSSKLNGVTYEKPKIKTSDRNSTYKNAIDDHPKRPKHDKSRELREITMRRRIESQERLPPKNERMNKAQNCTFKSLVRSLDEMRIKKFSKQKDNKQGVSEKRSIKLTGKISTTSAMESVPEEESNDFQDKTPKQPPSHYSIISAVEFHSSQKMSDARDQKDRSVPKTVQIRKKQFI